MFGSHSFIRSNRLNFDKICIFHKHLRSSCGAEKKFVKKNLQKRISPIEFHICYILTKRSLQKNYERNPFCGQNSIWGSYRDWLLNLLSNFPSLFVIGLKLKMIRWAIWNVSKDKRCTARRYSILVHYFYTELGHVSKKMALFSFPLSFALGL